MNFEFNILYFIHSFQSPLLNIVMKFVTKLGNGGMVWIILALAFFISKDKEKKTISPYNNTCLMYRISFRLFYIKADI